MNPRVPAQISALRRLNAQAGPRTRNLGLGQPAVDMPPSLRELAPLALANHRLGYTPNAGREDLREAIAGFYGLTRDGLVLTHGAQEGLMAVLYALLAAGDEVLVPDPGFLAYPTMVRIAGGEPRAYALGAGFRYDVDAILSALGPGTRAVLVCAPNNPTGTGFAAGERERLERELARREIFLICDEVYGELAFEGEYRPSCAELTVTVSSWSKSLALTGWRIGFAHTSHPELRARLLAAHQYMVTCASAPAQALLLETLRRPALYREIVSGFRAEYRGKLKKLSSRLGVAMPEGGFYLWLPVRGDDREVAQELLQAHDLLVVPGSFFGSRGAGQLRVSVAAGQDVLDEAAEIMARLPSV